MGTPSKESNWLKRVINNYDRTFLSVILITLFNDGLMMMRMLAMKDMFNTIYQVEPSAMQKYHIFT